MRVRLQHRLKAAPQLVDGLPRPPVRRAPDVDNQGNQQRFDRPSAAIFAAGAPQHQRAAVQRSAQRGPPRARHKRSVGFKHHAAVIRLQAARRMTRAEAVEQTAPEGQSSQLELAGIVQVRPIERYVFCRRCAVGIFSCSTQGRRVIAVRASKDDHPRDDLFLRTAKGIGRADSGGGAPQA